jgi:hypothetical protein
MSSGNWKALPSQKRIDPELVNCYFVNNYD